MKFMKKSAKKFCLKLAASILSTTIVASIALPMNVLATTVDTTTEILSENTTINSSSPDYSDNIIREVEEERDEFSKTFLMSDGTYYTYVSPVAIHEFIEDKWVDIDDSLSETPATIPEAEETVKEYINEAEKTASQISTFSLSEPNTSVTITGIGGVTQTTTGYRLTGNSALVIKPNEIIKYSANNKVLLSATINTTITNNTTNFNKTISIKNVSTDVNTNTTFAEINSESDIYYKMYKAGQSEYSFDITNIYSQWERGNLTNRGVSLVIKAINGMPFVISTPILSLKYKNVSDNDSSFTYHTLDLGSAGVLSINDVTNAFKLEQTIAGINCSLLPVTLTRIIDSAKFSLDCYANASSEWNYDYTLGINGSFATVILPQGTKLEFQKPETASNDSYQVWTQKTGESYVSDVKLYVTKKAADAGGIGNNYEDCYIDIDGIEYGFTPYGKLKYIEKANKRLLVSYGYSNEVDKLVINKLSDSMGNQYYITYSTYIINNINYLYASKIAVKDIDNNPIVIDGQPLEINVTNTVENAMLKSTFSYPGESSDNPITVSFGYDFNGKLLGIQSADGTITELCYKSDDNAFLTGYIQKKNDVVINSFTITSDNTYERVFEGSLIQKETQRYDSDFHLTTYNYGNNTIGITYKDGVIDSYALNNSNYEESQNIIDNGDFSIEPSKSLWTNINTDDIDNEFYYENNILVKNTTANATVGITQYIDALPVDKTLVFSAEANILESIPSNDYKVKIDLLIYDTDFNQIQQISLPFDLSLLNDTQTRLCAFKMDVPCSASVSICAEGNVGRFVVDNVRLYEATPEDGSIMIPGVSISDPITNTTIENGMITSETITDGTLYMMQNYQYNYDNSKMISSIDFNGVSSAFDFNGYTGRLSAKGYIRDGEEIVNPIQYTYYGTGLLKSVTQLVNSVANTPTSHLLKYEYDTSNRVTSVSNNGYKYVFTYDDLGKITNIKKESLTNNSTIINNLIDYTYTNNNIGSIVYSNGYKLEYEYNDNGEITNITCFKTDGEKTSNIGSYSYTYTNGRISETLIQSNDLPYNVRIVETDKKIEIYHIQNNSEKLIYSKTVSPYDTVEEYKSSATGSEISENFIRTNVTETKNGNNTETYSEFSGSKVSSLLDNTKNVFSGSNTIVKDYFGRTSEKYFTLSNSNINTANNATIQTDNLSLLHRYSYYNLGSDESEYDQIRTSNLISRVDNIAYSESTTTDGTTTDGTDVSYNYIYDNKGNIRFVYRQIANGNYVLENYYQYDETNQITVSFDFDEFVFYNYDNNGNITEKTSGGVVSVAGMSTLNLEQIYTISTDSWNETFTDSLKNISFSNSEPEKKEKYTYNALGILCRYTEEHYTYHDNSDDITTDTVVDVSITYDELGNPLKYIGKSPTTTGNIFADLTWNGHLLESAIIYNGSEPEQKLTFVYDENGYRINKTVYECSVDSENNIICAEIQRIDYIWDNGTLLGIRIAYPDQNTHSYMYTNILYDNTGNPYGITTPTGLAYYFLRDACDNIRGLIDSEGKLVAYLSYDAFGNPEMDITGDTIGDAIIHGFSVLYNPCTYKGYLYDYELGMYFIQNKCYSPQYGRFINETNIDSLTEPKNIPLDMNLYLFCNNNPVNNFDVNAEWNRDKFSFMSDQSHGIQVEMSKAFLSRPFCTLYASKIISDSGSWDYLNGRSFKNMGVERIASNLFARCVGNYAESAINRVNATWGDGWIVSNRNSKFIIISETDPNYDKYLEIWLAAPSIKSFATASGIYITL